MRSSFEQGYIGQLDALLAVGSPRADRTNVGTQAVFGRELVHSWVDGFPLITHRTLSAKAAIAEMVCFIRGFTDVSEFSKRGCNWWQANLNDFNKRKGTPDNTDLGPIYGSKWRNFHGFDQLLWLVGEAEKNPHSRRLMVTAWDPSDQEKAVLPPCHHSWQIFIDGPHLDLMFNMRSVDWVLGCPADMVAYAFLQLALCRHLGKSPRELVGHFGDTHVYKNHIDGAKIICEDSINRSLPKWQFSEDAPTNMFQLEPHHLVLTDVDQGPSMKFAMAV